MIIVVAVGVVITVMVGIAFLLREPPKAAKPVSLKFVVGDATVAT